MGMQCVNLDTLSPRRSRHALDGVLSKGLVSCKEICVSWPNGVDCTHDYELG